MPRFSQHPTLVVIPQLGLEVEVAHESVQASHWIINQGNPTQFFQLKDISSTQISQEASRYGNSKFNKEFLSEDINLILILNRKFTLL